MSIRFVIFIPPMYCRAALTVVCFIIFAFCSCSILTENSRNHDPEIEIYTLVINDLLESDSKFRNEAKFDTQNDHLNMIETLSVYVPDSTSEIYPVFKKMIRDNFLNYDTSSQVQNNTTFDDLLKILLTSDKRVDINSSLIKPINNYVIIEYDSIPNLETVYEDFAGYLEFSNIIFSDHLSKAVMYASSCKALLNAAGYVYFLEFKFGKWKIYNYYMVWIS